MKKRKSWYENKDFWHTVGPILFRRERWQMAPEEVEHVISLLQIKPGAKILDLCCGVGRHSIEFARRGFDVTGVDATVRYLKEAVKKTKNTELSIEFIRDDMRRFKRKNSFDAVVSLFTSFGYFDKQDEDVRVIKNVYGSLRKHGVFLLETMGKEVLARIFRKRDWYEIDGTIVLEERNPDGKWSRIENRWIIIRGIKRKEFRISIRLYSALELSSILESVGFRKIDVYGDLTGSPYDHNAKRLVVVAHK